MSLHPDLSSGEREERAPAAISQPSAVDFWLHCCPKMDQMIPLHLNIPLQVVSFFYCLVVGPIRHQAIKENGDQQMEARVPQLCRPLVWECGKVTPAELRFRLPVRSLLVPLGTVESSPPG